MSSYANANEWLMLSEYRWATNNELYSLCAEIQAEMDRRILAGTADLTLLIDGNRNSLDGEIDFRDFTPLLGKLKEMYPERFTKKAAADYLMSIPVNQQAINKLMKL